MAATPLAPTLVASGRTEREVIEATYAEHRRLRALLFDDLRRKHPNIAPAELLGSSQTIVGRVLVIAIAERRGIWPSGTIAATSARRDPEARRPLWQNFLALFRRIDRADEALGVPAFHGRLYRRAPELEELDVSDELCRALARLSEYASREGASVDVLGHIFERSITDLERLREQVEAPPTRSAPPSSVGRARAPRAPSKRKTDGVFYTPPVLTSFLVRATLGRALAEAWERAGAQPRATREGRIAAWEAYQTELARARVLDLACGSGALLMAAFDALAREYERSNHALAELRGSRSGLRDPALTVLTENLFGVDTSAESVEITRLSLWLRAAAPGRPSPWIDSNIRRGNSVVSDAGLDPWAFDWATGRGAGARLELGAPQGRGPGLSDARWQEGFDVVIGNPPYVRHERLTAYKDHWRSTFEAYDGAADLFVYFFERGLRQLKPGGRLGFIVSNKWLRGGYAERLRALLAREYTIDALVDLGHAPIFRGADAFPCIITVRKAPPPPEHAVRVTLYPREELGEELLESDVETRSFLIPQRALSRAGWTLEPPFLQAIFETIRRSGAPLCEYAGVKPLYGIKTGCNEAFLVDRATKARLCEEDARSAQILKKYLRGRDVARWAPEPAEVWFLLLKSSGDFAWPWASCATEAQAERVFARSFPAVYGHLKPLEAKLRGRADRGRFWWELRPCAYYDRFEKPALLYPDILWRSSFCLAPAGSYTNNTNYLVPTDDLWLLCCLNAPVMWSYLWRTAQRAKDDALRMFGGYVAALPIATPTPLQREIAVESASRLIALTAASRRAASPALGAEAPEVVEERAQILALERDIARVVHAAYGLNDGDLAALRAAAPPRMPPGS